jgi:hypothetical protein
VSGAEALRDKPVGLPFVVEGGTEDVPAAGAVRVTYDFRGEPQECMVPFGPALKLQTSSGAFVGSRGCEWSHMRAAWDRLVGNLRDERDPDRVIALCDTLLDIYDRGATTVYQGSDQLVLAGDDLPSAMSVELIREQTLVNAKEARDCGYRNVSETGGGEARYKMYSDGVAQASQGALRGNYGVSLTPSPKRSCYGSTTGREQSCYGGP